MISLSRVHKSFGQNEALKNVSLKIQKGEIVGFLGPNGAGKTTTMRLLLGLIKASSGSIHIDGLDPISDRTRILSQTGYLAEDNPLYQEMTVEEYLLFIASVKNAELYQDLIYEVGIEDKMKDVISTLSRGFKQRVGLAGALLGNPDILILDEPTSGLDPIEQKSIRTFIKRLSTDKIIVFSTHILSEVEDIAKRLVIINKGEIVYDGKKPNGKGSVEKLFSDVVMHETKPTKKKQSQKLHKRHAKKTI